VGFGEIDVLARLHDEADDATARTDASSDGGAALDAAYEQMRREREGWQ